MLNKYLSSVAPNGYFKSGAKIEESQPFLNTYVFYLEVHVWGWMVLHLIFWLSFNYHPCVIHVHYYTYNIIIIIHYFYLLVIHDWYACKLNGRPIKHRKNRGANICTPLSSQIWRTTFNRIIMIILWTNNFKYWIISIEDDIFEL